MRKLKVVSLLASLTCALGVAACGSDDAASGGDGGGTLNLLAENGTNLKQSGLIERFQQQHPDIKVKLTEYPWQTAHDKLVATFSSGDSPDVALAEDQWVGEFARLGALAPLDEFKQREGYQDADFHPSSWSYFVSRLDGKLYAAPAYTEARALFWRVDAFEAAGIDEPPKTLDELLEVGKKLTDGEHQFGLADQQGDLDLHFYSWLLYANGGDVYDDGGEKCTLTSPQAVEALSFYRRLYDENVIPKDQAKRVETAQGFEEGYYAMAESGSWWFSLLDSEAPQLKGKWRVAPLPAGKAPISYGHPNAWIVPAKAKNKAAAEAWIKFMLDPKNGADWFAASGLMPPAKAALEDERLASNEGVRAMLEAADKGTNSVHDVPNGQAVTLEIVKMLSQVKNGDAAPGDAAKAACQNIDRLLAG